MHFQVAEPPHCQPVLTMSTLFRLFTHPITTLAVIHRTIRKWPLPGPICKIILITSESGVMLGNGQHRIFLIKQSYFLKGNQENRVGRHEDSSPR